MKKNRIENLFPNKKNPIPIEKRVSMYLPKEDHDWAIKFCTLLTEREDFLQIKKEIRLFEISLLQKYHDLFLKKLEDGISSDDFSHFMEDVNFIKTAASSCSSSVVRMETDFLQNSNQIDELESFYNTLFFFLNQNDNPLVMEAERRFYNQVNEKIADPDLFLIYSTEKEELSKHLYRFCMSGYNSFCRRKELFQTREFNYYLRDCQSMHVYRENQKRR